MRHCVSPVWADRTSRHARPPPRGGRSALLLLLVVAGLTLKGVKTCRPVGRTAGYTVRSSLKKMLYVLHNKNTALHVGCPNLLVTCSNSSAGMIVSKCVFISSTKFSKTKNKKLS